VTGARERRWDQLVTLGGALQRRALRAGRRVRARLVPPRVEVVFHTGYLPPDNEIADARRSAKILDHLIREGRLAPGDVRVPPPIEVLTLRRVHTDAYLESLDSPRAVARALGAASMPAQAAEAYVSAQRWATAGTLHAARLACSTGGLAVNLGGGFHHAERARGGGFCLFHDVAVAIEELRARGFFGRILVIDLDLHQGDGTRRIFRDDSNVTAVSLHATAWDEDPAPYAIDVAIGSGVGDATYLEATRSILDRAFAVAQPALVFYVAGVDIAIDDALGSMRVSADAIAERDRMVLERAANLPTVMVLAGGYGQEAWRYSARTLVHVLSGEDRPIPATHDRALGQLRRIARTLGERELQAGETAHDDANMGITEADLLGDLVQKTPSDQLLGFYSAFGLEVAFERYGMFELLRKRGYPRLRLTLDVRTGSGQAVTVRSADDPPELLIELVVRELRDAVPFRLLSIEWLLLQDPRARPTAGRPLLPGQLHPGLGGLRIMVGMLAMAAERLGFDGLTFVPAHFHTAAQARGLLRFLEPEAEALFSAIKEALGARTLLDASHAMAQRALVDATTGEPVAWKPSRMVLPLTPALLEKVQGPAFDARVEASARHLHFVG
jgi:acetoin utilization deacetylase AcuC-like enzyme